MTDHFQIKDLTPHLRVHPPPSAAKVLATPILQGAH